jgi:phage-related protein
MGFLLRRLQRRESLAMPHSRPMPGLGSGCHELRVKDSSGNWRLIYRIDADAIVVVEVIAKKTNRTPKAVLEVCRKHLKEYGYAGK